MDVKEVQWSELQRDPRGVAALADAAEFIKAARISAELAQWSVLAEMLRGWKATAVIYADPDLLRQLTGRLNDDLGPVPVPVEDGADEH